MATTNFIILVHVCTIVFVMSKSNALTFPNFSSIIVFGDSMVDPGNNNNNIPTVGKGNHLSYGRDFPGHVPTDRFSNGKLITDFIASVLSIKDSVPPFLDPNLSNEELLTGVSFASDGLGYYNMTAVAIGGDAISMPKQMEFFKTYIETLMRGDALVVISAGSIDLFFNFYDIPTRRTMFNIDRYQDYLHDRIQMSIKELYDLGCRKLAVIRLPPLGCISFEIIIKHIKGRKCLENENSDSELYNRKLAGRLPQIQVMLPGSRVVYAEVYVPLINLINQPQKYGIKVTNLGCCGSDIFGVAPFCIELTPVCADTSKYVFWDNVHPTQATYKYIAKYLEIQALPQFLSQ